MAYSKVHWKKYLGGNHKSINQYISQFGDKFIIQTHQRIRSAYRTKKPEIILIRFRDSEVVSTIKSKHYQYALEKLLNLCIKFEKYELCRDIQTTIDLIKKRKKRMVTI